MKELTQFQAIYHAGIMDGEGTICIERHKKKAYNNYSYGLFVCVTNTDLELLHSLRSDAEIGTINPKPRSNNWKPCWRWDLNVDEIKLYLPQILYFLRVKRLRAELMLEFIAKTRYVGPHTPLTEEEIILKDVIFQEMKELNKRGGI